MDDISRVHRECCLKQHLPCLLLDVTPLIFLIFFFFPFSFLSRFPDPGLKMKRKSYCLITTAVTSIKCYLKVNGLHMLKTLELLTDHCKVSRIFNNLHVMHNPAIFGAEQTVSLASLCQGSQQKPLLHSSLTWQNRQKVLKTEPHGTALSAAKIPYFPKMKWKTGMAGGFLVFKRQWKVSDPLLEVGLEHRQEEEHCSSLKAT